MVTTSSYQASLAIKKACRDLKTGRLIAYPTEAVFGIGCDALNRKALCKLRKIKNRDRHKGFIVLCSSVSQLQKNIPAISLGTAQWELLGQAQAYPTTWLLPVNNRVRNDIDSLLIGHNKTLAVRITHHPVAKTLCEQLGRPLVSSSANKAGAKPAKNMLMVRKNFRAQLNGYLNGPLGNAKGPSQIIDITSGKIIRAAKT
jgi:L-threonylcarbamoyladenylate synthase